jgi:putative ABC transport system ATP-binding protein
MIVDALEVHGLRRTFASREDEGAPVRALRGIDLSVAEGEFVAIMGPSGCGKSTLMNLVAGLDSSTEGTISVGGEMVTGMNEDARARFRRKHIGIVFQFFNLLEGMSVLENVALPSIIAGSSRRAAETRAKDLLDILGISEKTSKLPGVLSGGQRQRLAIARSLANEPTGSLDSAGGAEILELLRRLRTEGQTIVLVTHGDAVAEAADRIVRMRDGRVDLGTDDARTGPDDPVFGDLVVEAAK